MVITGGSSGIGRATAAAFGAQGWAVGIIARGQAGLDSICAELRAEGVPAAAAAADVSDADALEAAAATLEAALGPITVWVNGAGNGVYGRFQDVSPAEFRRVTDVTYGGTVNGTRVALARMLPRDAGVIINICSGIAFGGIPFLSSYSGAKHAVRGFTDSLRHELRHDGARVVLTTIFPPAVNTPFFAHALSHLPGSPRPAKPVYQPEIVADAVVLAATRRLREIRVSGTTALFSLAMRMVPGLVERAIGRLGMEAQLTDDSAALQVREPTLFAPSDRASGSHGTFDAESRRFSTQMWLLKRRPAWWR